MKRRHLTFVTVVSAMLLVALPGLAQFRVQPLAGESGEVGLGLLLRRLGTVGVFMQATAHPDDEDNGLLVMYGRGLGYRTVLATATRGDGGQNEIGPELFEALGVLRTDELHSMHWVDGAEQYFTRAVDFGYSFSIDETFEKWGRDEILGDFVRLIRTIRPDVMAALSPEGTGGGQHHQASAVLAREAFRAAGDPGRYPEQLREGLRPWQAEKFYFRAGFGRGRPTGRFCAINTGVFDPLLGKTYAEIGAEARSMHKCQGFGQLLPVPGLSGRGFRPGLSQYQLVDTTIPGQMDRVETSLFDGVATSLQSLARYAATPPQALVDGLTAIASAVEAARAGMDGGGPEAAAPALASGLAAVRALRDGLADLGLDDDARFEIDLRLASKEQDFERALLLAAGARLETLADDGVVIDGQPVTVTVIAAVRSDLPVAVTGVAFDGLEAVDGSACAPGPLDAGVYRCDASLRIPADARITAPYWKPVPGAARYDFDPDVPFGVPFRPTPFRVRLDLDVDGTPVHVERAVEYRYEGNIFSGEKRMELKVVPGLAVTLTPGIAIIPASEAAEREGRDVRVTVTNSAPGAAKGTVALEVPSGWRAEPASAPLAFTREDEAQAVRFTVVAPADTAPGAFEIRAVAQTGGQRFDRGYEVVEYPHVERRHLDVPARSTLKVIDVTVPPDLQVGYIMGVGDQVPAAIQQLGASLTLIDADELAWGDLDHYDAIVTGVRAYERRDDLRANNNRLLAYAEHGGTVIVQYNKFEFNDAQYGPYPVRVSNDRVTDEFAPVTILEPDHPIFNYPNRITDEAWRGWVQERGLYFLGERDPRYHDLVELEDPFPYNRGVKRGALVEAQVGSGRWVYVGLGLWRQLPAGTDGAYELLANLISLGRAPGSQGTPAGRGQ